MKNCSKHAIKRWVERVVKKTGKREIDEYASKNRDIIVQNINKSFEYATFVWTGQLGDNITRNYYVKDVMIFVTNVTDDTIITVMVADFGFSDSINLDIARSLLAEINELQEKINNEKPEIDEAIEHINYDIDDYESELESLHSKIKYYEGEIEVAKIKLDNIKKNRSILEIDLKQSIGRLVNSKEYRKDLEEM